MAEMMPQGMSCFSRILVSIICRRSQRDFLLDTIAGHSESDMKVVSFPAWEVSDQESYRDVPIVPLAELTNEDQDMILLALPSKHNLTKVMLRLHEQKLRNVYFLHHFALENHEDFIRGGALDPQKTDRAPEGAERPAFGNLDVHVCDQCNLNCKSCNHFAPFVRERKVTDPVRFDEDIRHFSTLFSQVANFALVGGEPLLEPEACLKMQESIRVLSRLIQPCSMCRWCGAWPIAWTDWEPAAREPDAKKWLVERSG